MSNRRTAAGLTVALGALLSMGCTGRGERSDEGRYRDQFDGVRGRLAAAGARGYCVLTPGAVWTYNEKGGGAGGEVLVITVTDQTRVVDGETTRIVEERETVGGALKEVSRNFVAIHRETGDLYYFGEEVDIYKDGRIAGHEGAWESGRNGARFGMLLPASPRVGMKYYQEMAPGVAMDRAEVISTSGRETTPAGRFDDVLIVRETSPLETGSGRKWYAPGVGLIRDGDLVLVSYRPGRGGMERGAGDAPPPSSPASPTLSESQKIDALLGALETSNGVFIRNGVGYDGARAAEHLRGKLKAAGSRVATAREFIDRLASSSSTSGKEYRVRLPDGTEVASRRWFQDRLAEIEGRE